MAELTSNEPTQGEYLQQVTLVKLMQCYDLLVVIANAANEAQTDAVTQLHDSGKFLFPDILVADESDVTDE